MLDEMDFHAAKALLDWQIELGADEALLDAPVNRFDMVDAAPKQAGPARAAVTDAPAVVVQDADAVAAARQMAAAADSLDALRAAMAAYPHCDLRLGARQLVFADGVPGARVMIVGEAPGREEDLQGKPFVGPAGQLLDKMLAAIGLNRAESVYLTNMLPWRPPQNADPTQAQLDMMRPFVERHITLAAPDMVVLMGNAACQGLLGRQGIMRMRGQWDTVLGRPALPMFHPAFLLRQPIMKREAWADLLSITARLEG